MTFIDTVADLLILVDEPEYRDRTLPKRDRNHESLPPRKQCLINEQIQMLTGSKTNSHRQKPGDLQRIFFQGNAESGKRDAISLMRNVFETLIATSTKNKSGQFIS